MAEDLYQKFVKTSKNKKVKSVHLENWPKFKKVDAKLLNEMDEVRKIASLALEARAKAGIKIRQPLSSLVIKKENLDGKKQLISLIEDEVNIKKVLFDKKIEGDIFLDTKITEDLKEEGDVREFSRGLQDLRKKNGFNVSDKVSAIIKTDSVGKTFIQKFEKEIKKATGLVKIDFKDISGETINLSGMVFLVKLF
jgi:isoleucyl-tRNA synthetase